VTARGPWFQFLPAGTRNGASVAKLADVCQSSVLRRHPNEATMLGRSQTCRGCRESPGDIRPLSAGALAPPCCRAEEVVVGRCPTLAPRRV